jgi:hypothetical protein
MPEGMSTSEAAYIATLTSPAYPNKLAVRDMIKANNSPEHSMIVKLLTMYVSVRDSSFDRSRMMRISRPRPEIMVKIPEKAWINE